MIDREDRDTCPGAFAAEIAACLSSQFEDQPLLKFSVVIKNTCYENWLISDTRALERMPARFRITQADINRIVPNKADTCNAQELLRAAAQRDAYNKVADAIRIIKLADPMTMAANSRSFRKFMRVIECRGYEDQSRRPAH